ncbi:MAG: hypothetical protein A3B89_03415 [Candidatus Buchananbacteria bacterium RIFCSPHIGHO2_02_FULL_40_13]|uniref:Uncharacterized protein n=1 Tax=Candidatus Buchananbacteria bacterium RIFCSPLOWO2_01_FULL_39_33 TaxID=1797543 RepID=A0A1G1YHD9_9BACT|nr:MAG: hypothetical protein A3B89_03415 [Candidatus Buchananbacteria bacterium RIFCSPHIGHO2_02_FULL_40_13]OGY51778.1 MAG: hypothetical protein A3A02_04080 [Candidatus Buchananbacteria bacterium RIFCSPLOWO2_01_FULL_39_33]
MKYPALNEIFRLKIDGDLLGNSPFSMVRASDHQPNDWRYVGNFIRGIQEREFRLVNTNTVVINIGEARKALAMVHTITTCESQWLWAFQLQFPIYDHNGPIGFADPAWIDPHGNIRFPCINTDGRLGFFPSHLMLYNFWRFLVPV